MAVLTFTRRQREIVRLIARGRRPAQIVEDLEISEAAVTAELGSLLDKLGVDEITKIPEAYFERTADDPYPQLHAPSEKA